MDPDRLSTRYRVALSIPGWPRVEDDTVWVVRRELPHLGHALVFLHRPPIRLAMALVVVGCALAAGLHLIWRPRRMGH